MSLGDVPQQRSRHRELPNLPLEDALQLVHLFAECGSPKYEKAAMRWLKRYLADGSPRLQHFAEITASLANRASPDLASATCGSKERELEAGGRN